MNSKFKSRKNHNTSAANMRSSCYDKAQSSALQALGLSCPQWNRHLQHRLLSHHHLVHPQSHPHCLNPHLHHNLFQCNLLHCNLLRGLLLQVSLDHACGCLLCNHWCFIFLCLGLCSFHFCLGFLSKVRLMLCGSIPTAAHELDILFQRSCLRLECLATCMFGSCLGLLSLELSLQALHFSFQLCFGLLSFSTLLNLAFLHCQLLFEVGIVDADLLGLLECSIGVLNCVLELNIQQRGGLGHVVELCKLSLLCRGAVHRSLVLMHMPVRL